LATTLITGGTGFIGQHLARRLLAIGDRVVLFDLFPDANAIRDVATDVTLVQGDVSLLPDVLRAIKTHRVDRIAHCAYMIGAENEDNPPLALRVNCLGNNNVFEAARLEGVQRITWTSSVSLYGRSNGHDAVDEDDPCWPVRVYGMLKQFDENLAEHYHRRFKVEHIAVRPSSVYGPGRLRGNLQYIQEWLKAAALGREVHIPGGDEMDNWSYVEDVAGALFAGITASQLPERRIFNIGGDYRSRSEFGEYLKKILPGARVTIAPGKEVQYRPRQINENIAKHLGFTPQWSLERGVLATVNWYRSNAGLAAVG
jgi:UDP-glucose 4-epimerase